MPARSFGKYETFQQWLHVRHVTLDLCQVGDSSASGRLLAHPTGCEPVPTVEVEPALRERQQYGKENAPKTLGDSLRDRIGRQMQADFASI
jgi:hypothetical protein